MNSTSPSSSLVRMAARSPARSSAGPDVMCSVHAHLGGDDARQRGLAQAGWPGEAAGGRRPGPAGGPPPARCRGAPSARAGRRTRPGGGAGARPRPPSSASSPTPGSRNSSRTAGPQQLAGRRAAASPRRRRVGSSRRASRISSGRSRGRPARRARRRRRSRPPPAARRRRGRAPGSTAGSCSSTSSRSAVFLPTPGTRHSAARSSLATMSTSAAGRVGGQDRQRQGRADAVGGDQHLERHPLVAGGEAVERLGVLADVVVDVEEHRRRRAPARPASAA